MLVKLKAHGFWNNTSNLNYLKNIKPKVQIDNKFSLERNTIAGVPQRSIDRPLLFNLFISNLALFIQYSVLSNYANDNLFITGKNKKDISLFLLDIEIVNNRFYENLMILNPGKSHYVSWKNLDNNVSAQL